MAEGGWVAVAACGTKRHRSINGARHQAPRREPRVAVKRLAVGFGTRDAKAAHALRKNLYNPTEE
ncbi:hypothetical protein PENSUB_10000 [Penicillium subrubescens]|uniref:Uncharacterized protein n=1 Tax=Penicillium subrubescens TaxID=1316194 RepID=A0A1Q5TBK4_9EURO|nr:hypothetical protein PENSUB_10000 [Penicillium subrubescens]